MTLWFKTGQFKLLRIVDVTTDSSDKHCWIWSYTLLHDGKSGKLPHIYTYSITKILISSLPNIIQTREMAERTKQKERMYWSYRNKVLSVF